MVRQPFRSTLVRSTLALVALSGLALAQAFEPAPGVEVMLTDAAARVLVGYGIVDATGLVLELSTDRANLLMLVATPDGEVLSLEGELADGRVWFREGGAWLDLATWLERAGLSLRLAVDDEAAFLVGPAPGSVPPSASRVGRGDRGGDEDDEGDDAGDDREDDGDDRDDGDDGGEDDGDDQGGVDDPRDDEDDADADHDDDGDDNGDEDDDEDDDD